MSDTPSTGDTPDESTDAVEFNIETADEPTLRARAGELKAQIDALKAETPTLARAQEIVALTEQHNEAVKAVNAIASLDTPEIADFQDVTTSDADDITDGTATSAATEDPTTITEETAVADADPVTSDADLAAAAEGVLAGAGAPAEAVVASAAKRPTSPARTRPVTAWVAGAGQNAYSQGDTLATAEDLAAAWESKRTTLRTGPSGEPVRAVVAQLPRYENQDDLGIELLQRGNGVDTNDRLIAETVTAWTEARNARLEGRPVSAQVAAICDPLDIIREIPHEGVTSTPFSDLFPQRGVGRLGFTFTRASSINVAASGVALWDDDDQAGIDPDDSSTWKPTVLIECLDPVEVRAKEITTSVLVDTSTEMSSPERVAEFMDNLATFRARFREQYMLTQFDATAYGFTKTATYGSLHGLFEAVETLLPQLVYNERLPETAYDLVIDPGYIHKLTIDAEGRCNRDPAEVLAEIRRVLGIPVVVLQDFKGASSFTQTLPSLGSSTALASLPSVNRVRLVPAGSYIYGATGEQATGWQTDPQLARQNRMQAFSAEWLLLAKHGKAPAAFIDITSTPDGSLGACA